MLATLAKPAKLASHYRPVSQERENGSVSVDRLMSTGEAAKAVGLSHRSLSRWASEGKLKPTMVTPGGHPRWTERDLRAQLSGLRDG